MHLYLENACRWFGPVSCETASLVDLGEMFVAIVMAVVAAIWLMGKIGVVLNGS